MSRLITDDAFQGITVYNSFIEDANYSFCHISGDEGYRSGEEYIIDGKDFRYIFTSYYYECFYPEVNRRAETLQLASKDKRIEYSGNSECYMIKGGDELHNKYYCDGTTMYDRLNAPLFVISEDGSVFTNYAENVIYDPATDKVYLSRLGGYEINFDKYIMEQVNEYVKSHYQKNIIRKNIQDEIEKIANKQDYRLGKIDSIIFSLLDEFKSPITEDDKLRVANAVKTIKEYYRRYVDCMNFKVEADALIKQIDNALSTITNIVNEEYRMIPGSHAYTTDEIVKVNVNSKDKIRKTFNKEPQE